MSARVESKRILGLALVVLSSCGSNKKPGPEAIAASTEVAPAVMTGDTAVQANANADLTNAARATRPAADAKFNPRLLRRFKPISGRFDGDRPASDAEIKLGRMLYYEKRLSKDRDLSCNSCHDLSRYGVDGQATSLGVGGQHGERNSPTVYHAAGYFAEFWDGRAANVEEQAKAPISNPTEMGSTPEATVRVLKSIPEYSKLFAAAFPGQPDPLTFDNVGHAIGAFERGLSTPSRWDKYLAGDSKALTAVEVEGLRVFTNVGCMVCHTGEFLGANSYQRVGAVEPWPNQRDQGRYAFTKTEADRMMFKVPSLRNVEMTGPYFHDGSARTIDDAVRVMGKYQLGLELSDAEVASVVAWLKSLTGELPRDYIVAPELPKGATATGSGG
jgi:cytochrome c peroxidase